MRLLTVILLSTACLNIQAETHKPQDLLDFINVIPESKGMNKDLKQWVVFGFYPSCVGQAGDMVAPLKAAQICTHCSVCMVEMFSKLKKRHGKKRANELFVKKLIILTAFCGKKTAKDLKLLEEL